MKKNQRIKLILDLINKKRKAAPKKETFCFQYEELTKFPLLNDQIMLNQLFSRIQKESDCIVFILPKVPEHIIGKPIIEEGSREAAIFETIYDFSHNKKEDFIKLDAETIKSFSTITIHIEDFIKFDKYNKKIKIELKKEKVSVLILNDNGELYNPNDKENYLYPMNIKKSRYRIVHYMATEREWLQSKELAEECGVDSKKVGKTIEQIRRKIEDFIKVKGNEIIESKRGLGYRIKNIKIKET